MVKALIIGNKNPSQKYDPGFRVQARDSYRFGRTGATPGKGSAITADMSPAGARVLYVNFEIGPNYKMLDY